MFPRFLIFNGVLIWIVWSVGRVHKCSEGYFMFQALFYLTRIFYSPPSYPGKVVVAPSVLTKNSACCVGRAFVGWIYYLMGQNMKFHLKTTHIFKEICGHHVCWPLDILQWFWSWTTWNVITFGWTIELGVIKSQNNGILSSVYIYLYKAILCHSQN